MKTIRYGLPFLACLLLASCGGGNSAPAAGAASPAMQAAVRPAAAGATTDDYRDVVQQVYVGYFGRPADSGGLVYYEQLLLTNGAPTDLNSLNQSYGSNATIKSILDSFGTSAESAALYPGDSATFIQAVYGNLFNRVADDAGKAYWAKLIDSGALTRASAALAIMAGSQGSDLAIINNKTRVAANFTAALLTPLEQQGYSGLDANVVVRTMLGTVSAGTDVNAFQSTIDATLAGLSSTAGAAAYAQVATIIGNRCVACHSVHATLHVPGFGAPADGIAFDTAAQVHALSGLIAGQVSSGAMPYGNETGMTADERATIASWIALGAP